MFTDSLQFKSYQHLKYLKPNHLPVTVRTPPRRAL